jgi:PncC family amidohydrolase
LETPLEIQIGELLRAQGLSLSTAESCTGGLIADRITNIPGSSDYFLGGLVTYSNESKATLLDVRRETLEKFGAVSRETVLEMARGARGALHADLAVAVSGIAGPGGGLPGKPVGTTWLGLAADGHEWARAYCFRGDRLQNKSRSAEAALELVVEYLHGVRDLEADHRT